MIWYYANETRLYIAGTIAPFALGVIDWGLQKIIENTEPVKIINGNPGEFVEQKFGANATGYEVIDDIRISPDGRVHVTSIKTCSGDAGAIETLAKSELKKLQASRDFTPIKQTQYQHLPTISKNMVETKALIIAIPQDNTSVLRNSTLTNTINTLATKTQVAVRIVPVGGWLKRR
jgi:hypothetical protein